MRAYNIEVVYTDSTFDFTSLYAALVTSLNSVDSGFQAISPNVTQYPGRPNNPDFPLSVEDELYYNNAFSKVDDSAEQLKKVVNWADSNPYNFGRVVRVALYENKWSSDVLGLANVDWYRHSDSRHLKKLSSLIACDDYNSLLAHECGHNLGAQHVENTSDVMNGSPNGIWGAYDAYNHHDATNISKIKRSLTY
ncbi:MAG: zinc-dependent metalloprotease family protein [Chryseobacterium culicis]